MGAEAGPVEGEPLERGLRPAARRADVVVPPRLRPRPARRAGEGAGERGHSARGHEGPPPTVLQALDQSRHQYFRAHSDGGLVVLQALDSGCERAKQRLEMRRLHGALQGQLASRGVAFGGQERTLSGEAPAERAGSPRLPRNFGHLVMPIVGQDVCHADDQGSEAVPLPWGGRAAKGPLNYRHLAFFEGIGAQHQIVVRAAADVRHGLPPRRRLRARQAVVPRQAPHGAELLELPLDLQAPGVRGLDEQHPPRTPRPGLAVARQRLLRHRAAQGARVHDRCVVHQEHEGDRPNLVFLREGSGLGSVDSDDPALLARRV
mmetsp:Transcript_64261/g.144944  ORF Transcript_64261/g.144944 Transcript_64261/m.144944 type:complete len:319 (-) Transcript_64261:557-1513(-)